MQFDLPLVIQTLSPSVVALSGVFTLLAIVIACAYTRSRHGVRHGDTTSDGFSSDTHADCIVGAADIRKKTDGGGTTGKPPGDKWPVGSSEGVAN